MRAKKTWRLRSMSGEVADVMRSASSLGAVATVLGVNKSTVFRWLRAGKIPPLGGRRRGRVPLVPENWAASVKRAYDLDATELVLVELAEEALTLARDKNSAPAIRLQAMARFAALVRQLDLEVDDREAESTNGVSTRPWPRRVG